VKVRDYDNTLPFEVELGRGLYFLFRSWGANYCERFFRDPMYSVYLDYNKIDWAQVFVEDDAVILNKGINASFLYWIYYIESDHFLDELKVFFESYFFDVNKHHPVEYLIDNKLNEVLYFFINKLQYQLVDEVENIPELLEYVCMYGDFEQFSIMVEIDSFCSKDVFNFLKLLHDSPKDICWEEVLSHRGEGCLSCFATREELMTFLSWVSSRVANFRNKLEVDQKDNVFKFVIQYELYDVLEWLINSLQYHPWSLDVQGNTLLHYTAAFGDVSQLCDYLKNGNVSIYSCNALGENVKAFANKHGNTEIYNNAVQSLASDHAAYLFSANIAAFFGAFLVSFGITSNESLRPLSFTVFYLIIVQCLCSFNKVHPSADFFSNKIICCINNSSFKAKLFGVVALGASCAIRPSKSGDFLKDSAVEGVKMVLPIVVLESYCYFRGKTLPLR
jgi:hypothetical protein